MKQQIGPWFIVYECSKCQHTMSDSVRSYSDGVCPYCGNISCTTFVSTNIFVARRITKSWFDSKFPFFHIESKFEEKR